MQYTYIVSCCFPFNQACGDSLSGMEALGITQRSRTSLFTFDTCSHPRTAAQFVPPISLTPGRASPHLC